MLFRLELGIGLWLGLGNGDSSCQLPHHMCSLTLSLLSPGNCNSHSLRDPKSRNYYACPVCSHWSRVHSLKDGWTHLMYAVANDSPLHVVEALVDGKADLEAKNHVRDFVNDISLGLSEAILFLWGYRRLPFYLEPFYPSILCPFTPICFFI